MLIRMPLEEASRLLLDDDRQADYWDLVMPTLVQSGVAEVLERSTMEHLPGGEMKCELPLQQERMAYSAIALAGETPELAEDYLKKGTVKMGAGFEWKGKINKLSKVAAEAEWVVTWISPEIERRAIGPWAPVQGHRAEHITCRSAGVATQNVIMPWSRAVLLGAQVEPGFGDALHTGSMLLVFGRVEKGEDCWSLSPLLELPICAETHLDTLWVLTVPAQEYHSWNLQRSSVLEDEEAFRRWLARAGDDVKLEFVATGRGACFSWARQEWASARSFRTSNSSATHLPIPALALSVEQMDHMLSLGRGSMRCEWPIKKMTWTRMPISLPVTEATPALELPAVNMERFESWVQPHRDAPELIRAWTDSEGRVRVCFARRVPPTAAERRKQEPRVIQNAWCVDTPLLGWGERMDRLSGSEQAALADELLAEMRAGTVSLVDSMTCTNTFGFTASESQSGHGFTALEGLLTVKPRENGMYLTPSSVEEDFAFTSWAADWQQDGSLWKHQTRIRPEPLHWHVALPRMKSAPLVTTALRRSKIQTMPSLDDDVPCVLGAVSLPAGAEGRRSLRWWIVRQSALEPARATRSTPRRYLVAKVADRSGEVVERCALLLHPEMDTVVSRGVEVPFFEARQEASEPHLMQSLQSALPFHADWSVKRHVSGLLLAVRGSSWSFMMDVLPPTTVADLFTVGDENGPYELSLERPLFAQEIRTGTLPEDGVLATHSLGGQLALKLSVSQAEDSN